MKRPLNRWQQVGVGFFLVMVLHLVWLIFAPGAYVLLAIVQLLYVFPLFIGFAFARWWGHMQGVLLAAGVTFLLNTAYCAYGARLFGH